MSACDRAPTTCTCELHQCSECSVQMNDPDGHAIWCRIGDQMELGAAEAECARLRKKLDAVRAKLWAITQRNWSHPKGPTDAIHEVIAAILDGAE